MPDAVCVVCKNPIADRSTYIPTSRGPMHPHCWESQKGSLTMLKDVHTPFALPLEAYTFTERARLMSDAATEGMEEYGLGGLAYAKTRKVATVASEARAWQDLNTPEVIPEGSTAIPDVDKRTRPKTADGKNYNERPRQR